MLEMIVARQVYEERIRAAQNAYWFAHVRKTKKQSVLKSLLSLLVR